MTDAEHKAEQETQEKWRSAAEQFKGKSKVPFTLKREMTMGDVLLILGLVCTALLWFFKTGGQLQGILDAQRDTNSQVQSLQNDVRTQSSTITNLIRIIDWNHLQGPNPDPPATAMGKPK